MSPTRSFHRLARQEVREAFLWYEEQRPGLGEDFLELLELALDSGAHLKIPAGEPGASHPHYRRVLLKRFPYTLILEVGPDAEPFVLAVMHQRRRPGYWLKRQRPTRRRRRR